MEELKVFKPKISPDVVAVQITKENYWRVAKLCGAIVYRPPHLSGILGIELINSLDRQPPALFGDYLVLDNGLGDDRETQREARVVRKEIFEAGYSECTDRSTYELPE